MIRENETPKIKFPVNMDINCVLCNEAISCVINSYKQDVDCPSCRCSMYVSVSAGIHGISSSIAVKE